MPLILKASKKTTQPVRHLLPEMLRRFRVKKNQAEQLAALRNNVAYIKESMAKEGVCDRMLNPLIIKQAANF